MSREQDDLSRYYATSPETALVTDQLVQHLKKCAPGDIPDIVQQLIALAPKLRKDGMFVAVTDVNQDGSADPATVSELPLDVAKRRVQREVARMMWYGWNKFEGQRLNLLLPQELASLRQEICTLYEDGTDMILQYPNALLNNGLETSEQGKRIFLGRCSSHFLRKLYSLLFDSVINYYQLPPVKYSELSVGPHFQEYIEEMEELEQLGNLTQNDMLIELMVRFNPPDSFQDPIIELRNRQKENPATELYEIAVIREQLQQYLPEYRLRTYKNGIDVIDLIIMRIFYPEITLTKIAQQYASDGDQPTHQAISDLYLRTKEDILNSLDLNYLEQTASSKKAQPLPDTTRQDKVHQLRIHFGRPYQIQIDRPDFTQGIDRMYPWERVGYPTTQAHEALRQHLMKTIPYRKEERAALQVCLDWLPEGIQTLRDNPTLHKNGPQIISALDRAAVRTYLTDPDLYRPYLYAAFGYDEFCYQQRPRG